MRNNSNPVIAVIPDDIRTISQLVYWIPIKKTGDKLYHFSESKYRPCPLERNFISNHVGLPNPKLHHADLRELVIIMTDLAQTNPDGFRNISNQYERWIIYEFLSQLKQWYSYDRYVQQLFRNQILRDLLSKSV
jgi:hypothetical protein